MGVYLKFLGILIFLSGFLLGGLSLYYDRDYQELNRTLSKIDKKYEKIGKELESAVTKRLERVPFLREEELRKARGISLMFGGVIIGSLFLGLGEAVSLLKRISKKL
jgi:hypothetical protein